MRPTISKRKYLQAAQNFQWATPEHYNMWFYGDIKRHRRTEVMLPRLMEEERIWVVRWANRKIYIAPKLKDNTHYEHGLGVTEILVRLWRADMNSEIVPTRFFRGLNCIPDGALKYGEKLLLYEFCTADNFKRVLKQKWRDTRITCGRSTRSFKRTRLWSLFWISPKKILRSFCQGKKDWSTSSLWITPLLNRSPSGSS